MRKLLFLIFLTLYSINATSQYKEPRSKNLPNYDNRRVHFGFSVGANVMDFGIIRDENFLNTSNIDEIYSIENKRYTGFSLGPIVNFHLGEYFDFRTLVILTFGQRDLQYQALVNNNNSVRGKLELHTMKLSSTYMEFPLLLKYKGKRFNNFRPYIIGGVNPKYDMASRKKSNDGEIPNVHLKKFDVAGELGAGFDFYLLYFKFSIELKYSIGLKNNLVYNKTQYTTAIERMTSNVWMLSFHFE